MLLCYDTLKVLSIFDKYRFCSSSSSSFSSNQSEYVCSWIEGLQNKQLVFVDTVTFVHLSICVHAQTIMTGRSEEQKKQK